MLSKVRIEGIKGLTNKEIVLNRYNLLSGPSGSNKSAVIEAIQLALTGNVASLKKGEIMNIATDDPQQTDKIVVELVYNENTDNEGTIKRIIQKKESTVSQSVFINGNKIGARESVSKIEEIVGIVPYAFDVAGFIKDPKKDDFLFMMFGDQITKMPALEMRDRVKLSIISLCDDYVAIAKHTMGVVDINDVPREKVGDIVGDFVSIMEKWPLKSVTDELFKRIDMISTKVSLDEFLNQAYSTIDGYTNELTQEKLASEKAVQKLKDSRDIEDITVTEEALEDKRLSFAKYDEMIRVHTAAMQDIAEKRKLIQAHKDGMLPILTEEELKEATLKVKTLTGNEKEHLETEKKDVAQRSVDEKELQNADDEYSKIFKSSDTLKHKVRLNEIKNTLERIATKESLEVELQKIEVPDIKKISNTLEKNIDGRQTKEKKLAVLESQTKDVEGRYSAAKMGVCPYEYCRAKINIDPEVAKKDVEKHHEAISKLKKKIDELRRKCDSGRKMVETANELIRKRDTFNVKLEGYKDLTIANKKQLTEENEKLYVTLSENNDKTTAAEDKVNRLRKSLELDNSTLVMLRSKINQTRNDLAQLNHKIENNAKYIAENAKREKAISGIKIDEIVPFDNTVIELRDKLAVEIKELEEKREYLIGEKAIEPKIVEMEKDALKKKGQAKFSRTAEESVKGLKNRMLDRVIGSLRDRVSDTAEAMFGRKAEFTTTDCGLIIRGGTVRDIRALSGGEGTALAVIILATALELVNSPERLLMVEGAEVDNRYTGKMFETLIGKKYDINMIMASNKIGIELPSEVEVIKFG